MAVFGMKSWAAAERWCVKGRNYAGRRSALRHELTCCHNISGMDSIEVLKQNLEVVQNFNPMSQQEMAELRNRSRAEAANGHLELFKTTTKYDGKVGREQHGYPDVEELPA